jgi:hypothetical protein
LKGLTRDEARRIATWEVEMKFIGIVALCVVILAAPDVAAAQSILEIAAGAKFCKTLTDDGQRLKCFDSLFAERSQQSEKQVETQANWNIEESKSPIDDSPQITRYPLSKSRLLLASQAQQQGWQQARALAIS